MKFLYIVGFTCHRYVPPFLFLRPWNPVLTRLPALSPLFSTHVGGSDSEWEYSCSVACPHYTHTLRMHTHRPDPIETPAWVLIVAKKCLFLCGALTTYSTTGFYVSDSHQSASSVHTVFQTHVHRFNMNVVISKDSWFKKIGPLYNKCTLSLLSLVVCDVVH